MLDFIRDDGHGPIVSTMGKIVEMLNMRKRVGFLEVRVAQTWSRLSSIYSINAICYRVIEKERRRKRKGRKDKETEERNKEGEMYQCTTMVCIYSVHLITC